MKQMQIDGLLKAGRAIADGDMVYADGSVRQRVRGEWILRKGIVFDSYMPNGDKKEEEAIQLSADDMLIVQMLIENGWRPCDAKDVVVRKINGQLSETGDEAVHIQEAQARIAAAAKTSKSLTWDELYKTPEIITDEQAAALPTQALSGVVRQLSRNLTGKRIAAFKRLYALYQTRRDRALPVSAKPTSTGYIGEAIARY